jgi:ipoprotein LpqH
VNLGMSTNAGIAGTNRLIFAAAAFLIIGAAGACSTVAAQKPESATLPPGTAHLTVNDKEVSTTQSVQCSNIGPLTTIKTGSEASGATVLVSNAGKLAIEYIRVRNVGGFTGDYNAGLEGEATVAMTGSTYEIHGTAVGYGPKSPEPTSEPITIKAAC